jgi:hypothetical protein
MGNEGEDHFEILASSLERQRVSAVAGGKLELPGQGVPKLELGNEGKDPHPFSFDVECSMFDVRCSFFPVDTGQKQRALMGPPPLKPKPAPRLRPLQPGSAYSEEPGGRRTITISSLEQKIVSC